MYDGSSASGIRSSQRVRRSFSFKNGKLQTDVSMADIDIELRDPAY
jgi:hypothetical protein